MINLIINFAGTIGGIAFFLWAYMMSIKVKYLIDVSLALKGKVEELEILIYSQNNRGNTIIQ